MSDFETHPVGTSGDIKQLELKLSMAYAALNAFIQVCPDNHTFLFATAEIECPLCKPRSCEHEEN